MIDLKGSAAGGAGGTEVGPISCDTGTTTVDSFADSEGHSAVWDIAVYQGANASKRTVEAAWDPSTNAVGYDEQVSNEQGDTSEVTFTVTFSGDNIVLSAVATGDGWTVDALRNVI